MHYPPRALYLWAPLLLTLIFSSASVAQTSDLPQRDAEILKSLYTRTDVDSAIVIARQLTIKYPGNPQPFHALGRLLLNAKNPALFPEAEAALDKCLTLGPMEPWMTAWSYLSCVCLLRNGARQSRERVLHTGDRSQRDEQLHRGGEEAPLQVFGKK